MTEDEVPGIKVEVSEGRVEVALPASDQSIVPVIPEELRDRDVPPFVIEWILESDEIATIAQELLQAPTRSLCREFKVPEGPPSAEGLTTEPQFQFQKWQSPTPPILRQRYFDVIGFGADAPETVEGLPAGIRLPRRVLDIIAMARKVDAWLWKGQRVYEWCVSEGVPDASWMPSTDA